MYFSDTKAIWMKFEDYFKVSNNIETAVYSFAMCEKVPDEKTSIVIEDTVYVGQSGGLENNYTVDKKNKDIEKGRLQTIFHQRMKAHSTAFNKENTKEIKYKLFHETYGYGNQIHRGDLTGKFLCVCIIVPPKHLKQEILKTWLLMVESEMIYLYYQHHGKLPIMNLAHKTTSSVNMINKKSFSQSELKKIKKQNLLELSS